MYVCNIVGRRRCKTTYLIWYLKFHAGGPTIFSQVQRSFKKFTV